MKKAISIFVLLGMVLFSSFAWAQSESKSKDLGVYIGVFGGGVFPEDLEMTDTRSPYVNLGDLDLDNGYIVGLKVGYNPPTLQYLGIELEFNHIADTDAGTQYCYTTNGTRVNVEGKASISSLFLNFILRHPEGRYHPYVGVGPGWAWFDFDDVRQSFTYGGVGFTTTKQDDSDSVFAYQILAGIEIDLIKNMSLDLGYKYYHCKPDVDKFGVDLDYSAHIATVGLKFLF